MRPVALLAVFLAVLSIGPRALLGQSSVQAPVLSSPSVRLGEVALLSWTPERPLSAARIRVFGKSIPAYAVSETAWQALIGVDLDQRPGPYRVEVEGTAGAETLSASTELVVVRRTFPQRTLSVAPDFVNPPPDLLARIQREQTLIRNAYAAPAADRLWSEPFVRPVPQPANSRFGTRSVFNGERRSPHAGTDFLSPAGTPIHAPNRGRVVVARELFYTGNTVILDHGLGVFSMMAHLSRIDVAEGNLVDRRQVVGLVGATGRVTGPHLHWALSITGARVDPLSLLALVGEKPQGN